jgi:hypothetical protein
MKILTAIQKDAKTIAVAKDQQQFLEDFSE